MNIYIYSIGKIKKEYLKEAIADYTKMLKSYASVKIIEFPDKKAPENISSKDMEIIKNEECEKILEKISDKDYVISLDILGKSLDSVKFSEKISEIMLMGHSKIIFVIGGSLGISNDLLKRSDFKLSFSKMTFPHQLMRVILLEQIYRAFRIINNHPYHK